MNKTPKRRALGRGLSNLIPTQDEGDTASHSGLVDIELASLATNPFQPRTDFDEGEIAGLAASIANQGLLQPLVVRKKVDGYQIISGERRYRAVSTLGWTQIPCIVKTDITDREMLEMALVENLQRENLNEIETALAYQSLLLECNLSHEELSHKIGKSRAAISNALRLLKLPASLQTMVRTGALAMGHARALLALADEARQKELAERVAREGLSVRDVEELVRVETGSVSTPRQRTAAKTTAVATGIAADPDVVEAVGKLQYRLGTTVRLVSAAAKPDTGKVEIAYHSAQDLHRVMNVLLT